MLHFYSINLTTNIAKFQSMEQNFLKTRIMVLNNCIMQGLLKRTILKLWLFSHWAVNERTALRCQLEQNSPVIFDKSKTSLAL